MSNQFERKIRFRKKLLSNKISTPKEVTSNIPQAINPQPIDIADQLERLAKLKTQGILSEEEFLQQKNKLLTL